PAAPRPGMPGADPEYSPSDVQRQEAFACAGTRAYWRSFSMDWKRAYGRLARTECGLESDRHLVAEPRLLPGLMDGDAGGVIERGCQARLPGEPVPEPDVFGQLGVEELQGHLPVEADVLGQVHPAHAAPAQQPLDAIPGDGGA